MSLDVTLNSPTETEILCYHCGETHKERESLYTANITHNLTEMANKAGIYKALWRPEEIEENLKAKDIIGLLEKGLLELKSNPDYFKQFNSPNKWGMYEHFVPFVEDYLNSCKEFPESIISVSR